MRRQTPYVIAKTMHRYALTGNHDYKMGGADEALDVSRCVFLERRAEHKEGQELKLAFSLLTAELLGCRLGERYVGRRKCKLHDG